MIPCCSPGDQVLCVATFTNSYIDVISKEHEKNWSIKSLVALAVSETQLLCRFFKYIITGHLETNMNGI